MRTSWVAARFIAAVTVARLWPWCRWMPRTSSSSRITGVYMNSSSAAWKSRAERLFQFVMNPLFGSVACGWAPAARKPRHSCLPVPSVGNPGSTPGARSGSRPAVYSAMCLLSA